MNTHGKDFLFDYTNLHMPFVLLRRQEMGVKDEGLDLQIASIRSHAPNLDTFLAANIKLKRKIYKKIAEGEAFWERNDRALAHLSGGREHEAKAMDATEHFGEGERKYYMGINPLLQEMANKMEKAGIDWRSFAK